jgi:hypothetical protein
VKQRHGFIRAVKMYVDELINREKLVHFVKCRLNADGGYSFSYPIYGVEFPSSVSETFYALAILSMLNEEIPSKTKTISYLHNIQRPDGMYDSVGVAFHAVKSLKLLNALPKNTAFTKQLFAVLREFKIFKEIFGDEFFSADYDMTDSPFKLAYQASKILYLLKEKIEKTDVLWLLPENKDGGFGIGHSDIVATYHAVATLHYGGYDVSKLKNTALFIEKCRTRDGGYALVPNSQPAYIETTYFAVATLKLLNHKINNTRELTQFIKNLQNDDGGFRRSPYLGVSTLCNSYFAIKTLSITGGEYNENNV